MTIRILAIDPGSTITGYGLVDFTGKQTRYVDSGCIRLGKEAMPIRLMMIHQGIQELIAHFKPREFAIEQIFMHANPNSALKLGQARGVAIAVAAIHGLPIGEYAPKAIKNAIVGTGGASKEQVQYMVKTVLGLTGNIQADAGDALAIALTHAHHLQTSLAHKKSGRLELWNQY
ncbi:crossover junction endodeoxyribonuclease RuvC [Ostreibacterium oceani]|uniref:Crossover junction endodeoxyribonuclease RuvC n=1 Tax=Ostreibacterium oceani TaxID=2654998 RepID=A0A6N7EYM2_9GAMM|nr:crossover junction endodeoxyribonuclease RuvC [Ostreibacterium oceani]MPV85578.1 crossover junction endodeoxyribonuclease RuvC [Ostreibacterium oceani]